MSRGFGSTDGGGTSDIITTSFSSGLTDGGVRTYSIWFTNNGYGGGGLGRIFDRSDIATANESFYNTSSPGLTYSVRYTTSNSQWAFDNTGVQDGNWHHAALTMDNGSPSNAPHCYVDGSERSQTFSAGGSGTTVNPSTAFTLGNRKSDSGRNWDGKLAEFAVWDAILTAAELAALAKGASPLTILPDKLVEYVPLLRANVSYLNAAPTITGAAVATHPRIIMPRKARFRRFTTAAGANKTLTASGGSYSITGTAASLLQARKVAAAAGSYALSGTNGALLQARKLAAAAGSYALTGTAASLLRGLNLAVDAGSYVITGTNVSLNKGRLIALDAGSYAIGGTDTSLLAQKELAADIGSYLIAGSDVSLSTSTDEVTTVDVGGKKKLKRKSRPADDDLTAEEVHWMRRKIAELKRAKTEREKEKIAKQVEVALAQATKDEEAAEVIERVAQTANYDTKAILNNIALLINIVNGLEHVVNRSEARLMEDEDDIEVLAIAL